jgi:hypothetical protein
MWVEALFQNSPMWCRISGGHKSGSPMWVEALPHSSKDHWGEDICVTLLNDSSNGGKEGANGTCCEFFRSDQQRQSISLRWKFDQDQDRWRSEPPHSHQRWQDAKSFPHIGRFHVESSENVFAQRPVDAPSSSESERVHVGGDRRRKHFSRRSSPRFHVQGFVFDNPNHSWSKGTGSTSTQGDARRSD